MVTCNINCKWQASGFSDQRGAPRVRNVSIRTLVWNYFVDITTAVLNGGPEEDFFMSQPEGFIDIKGKNKVCITYAYCEVPMQVWFSL